MRNISTKKREKINMCLDAELSIILLEVSLGLRCARVIFKVTLRKATEKIGNRGEIWLNLKKGRCGSKSIFYFMRIPFN